MGHSSEKAERIASRYRRTVQNLIHSCSISVVSIFADFGGSWILSRTQLPRRNGLNHAKPGIDEQIKSVRLPATTSARPRGRRRVRIVADDGPGCIVSSRTPPDRDRDWIKASPARPATLRSVPAQRRIEWFGLGNTFPALEGRPR